MKSWPTDQTELEADLERVSTYVQETGDKMATFANLIIPFTRLLPEDVPAFISDNFLILECKTSCSLSDLMHWDIIHDPQQDLISPAAPQNTFLPRKIYGQPGASKDFQS